MKDLGQEARFEHTFQKALFAVGSILIILGTAFAVFNMGGADEQGGLLEALSFGFSAVFFALFSGVMIGVGATLFINGLILGMKGNKVHMLLAFMFFILSLLISAAVISPAQASTFPMLTLFFSGMASAGAFLLSAVIFGFSGLLRLYLSRKK